MKDIFKNQLFNHGILVCEEKPTLDEAFAARYMLSKAYGVRVTSGKSLVSEDMVPYVADMLGENVPEPFYRGFPDSVRSLAPNQLLFDQLIHYLRTYGLGDFSEVGHSKMEDYIERQAFNEKIEAKNFSVLTESDAVIRLAEYVESFTAGTRPLSDDQYAFVSEYIKTYGYVVKSCASKNLAIRMLIDFRDVEYAKFISMSDVIKLVDELNYQVYGRKDVRKLNLKNQDRKFITSVINTLFHADSCDIRNCFEKKALWCGLLHHIHYKPVNENSAQFVQGMRGKDNFSVFAEFEKAMAEKDIRAAVDALKLGEGGGAVLRSLNYIISRCETDQDIDYVMTKIGSQNGVLLLQLLMEYARYEATQGARIFKFTKHNKLVIHPETREECARRKSVITDTVAEKLCSAVEAQLRVGYRGKLGKVYIDPAMKTMALPIQENTSSSGYGVLAKGSRIHIPEGKKVRAFTYWEKVNDIDLSVIGICANGDQREFSWRTMWGNQSSAITYSGDETSGYHGGSEFFDIDVERFKMMHPEIKHLVFCNNVFSNATFKACVCRAGYMLRDERDTGEIYEPKTVKTSFVIDCDSTFAYLFAIDFEKSDFIWLNVARESNAHVAGSTALDFMTSYFDVTSIMNMEKFFAMLATEIVERCEEADVLVTDANIQTRDSQEVIRSCDFERITQLMNA